MGNPFRGEVDIAGGAHRLVCDFNALCEIEAHFDGDIDDALRRIDSGDLDFRGQRAVVAALLRHHSPGVTLREAGQIITENIDQIHLSVRRSVALALPESDPEKKSGARAEIAGSGWRISSRRMFWPGWIRRIFGI